MADYSKLGYGEYAKIDTAVTEGTLEAKDIVITSDTSEFVYIRDDNTKQVIRSRIRLFDSADDAVTALNDDADTYAGQQVAILDEDGKYQIYTVQNGTDGFEVELQNSSATTTTTTGLEWVSF